MLFPSTPAYLEIHQYILLSLMHYIVFDMLK